MTLTILLIILSVFAIIGITEFLHNVYYSFLSNGNKNGAFLVYLSEETALDQLKLAFFERNWYGDRFSGIVIAAYDNLSFETLEICKDYIGQKDIVLVPIDYVSNVVKAVF